MTLKQKRQEIRDHERMATEAAIAGDYNGHQFHASQAIEARAELRLDVGLYIIAVSVGFIVMAFAAWSSVQAI